LTADTKPPSLYNSPAQEHLLTCWSVLMKYCRANGLPMNELHTQLVTPHRGQPTTLL